MNYYVSFNPCAEQILTSRLSSIDVSSVEFKRVQHLLEKVKVLRQVEDLSRQEIQNKLDNLLQQKELKAPKDCKAYIRLLA